jgi:hypothetical protein
MLQLSTITQIAALSTAFFCGVYLKRFDDILKIQKVFKEKVYAEPIYLIKTKPSKIPAAKIELHTFSPTAQKIASTIKEEVKLA